MLVYEKVIWNEEYYFNNELFFSHISYSHIDRLYKKCNELLKRYGKKQVNTVKSLKSRQPRVRSKLSAIWRCAFIGGLVKIFNFWTVYLFLFFTDIRSYLEPKVWDIFPNIYQKYKWSRKIQKSYWKMENWDIFWHNF